MAVSSHPSPAYRGADLNRRLAELLVECNIASRRDAEAALRDARRNGHGLTNVLLHSGRLPPKFVSLARRLELLLRQQPTCFHLGQLLVSSAALTSLEWRQLQAQHKDSGRSYGDMLLSNGLLWQKRQRQQNRLPRNFAAAVIVGLAFGTLGMMRQPVEPTMASSPVNGLQGSQVTMTAPAIKPAKGETDLRFASLGNITPQLERLQKRPAPYRTKAAEPAPIITKSIKQRLKQYRPLVNQYAKKYELPPALILALIEQESSFNPEARSPRNAVGLMQLVAHEGGSAAYRFSERKKGIPTLQELQDPKTNIRLGSAYLRLLLDRHFDDIQDEDLRVAVALAAYNWGPTRLRNLMERNGTPATVKELEALLEQHAPPETRNYVRKVTMRMDAFG